MDLTTEQHQFRRSSLAALEPESCPVGPVTSASPGNPDVADQLIDPQLRGKKTAGSGMAEDYLTEGDPLPEVGAYRIALESATPAFSSARTRSAPTRQRPALAAADIPVRDEPVRRGGTLGAPMICVEKVLAPGASAQVGEPRAIDQSAQLVVVGAASARRSGTGAVSAIARSGSSGGSAWASTSATPSRAGGSSPPPGRSAPTT